MVARVTGRLPTADNNNATKDLLPLWWHKLHQRQQRHSVSRQTLHLEISLFPNMFVLLPPNAMV